VRLPGIDHHLNRHLLAFERVIQLAALTQRHSQVCVAVLDERRRLDALNLEER
jgi:hypothetical protein